MAPLVTANRLCRSPAGTAQSIGPIVVGDLAILLRSLSFHRRAVVHVVRRIGEGHVGQAAGHDFLHGFHCVLSPQSRRCSQNPHIAGTVTAVLRRLRDCIVVGVAGASLFPAPGAVPSISSSLKPPISRLKRPPGATPTLPAASPRPNRIHRQTIVCDDQRARCVSERWSRTMTGTSVSRVSGGKAGARDPRNDHSIRANQMDRPPELDTAGGDLRDLLLRMRPRIADVGKSAVDLPTPREDRADTLGCPELS